MSNIMEQWEEKEFVRIVWVIQCLNPKGEERLLYRKHNHEETQMQYGRAHGDAVTSSYVVRQPCERYALEVFEDMLRLVEWEFDSENPKARGWGSPCIRELQGLHSFQIAKVKICSEVHTTNRIWTQPNCDPKRTVE